MQMPGLGFRSSVTGLLAAVLTSVCLTGCPDFKTPGSSQEGDPPVPVSSSGGGLEPGPRDPDAPEEFTTADSGLRYRVLRKGTGATPSASDTVVVHYRGTLDDGSEFDSSYSRGQTISFPLSGVIPGWTEGLQYVSEGGMIELEIPSDLGYGPRGMPPTIPGGATLHFIVELMEVK